MANYGRRRLAILFVGALLATPAKAGALTLQCEGKTYHDSGQTEENASELALLDLDKNTFKVPWINPLFFITVRSEKELSLRLDEGPYRGQGMLNRVTGRLEYTVTYNEPPKPPDRWSSVGVCRPAKKLF
jgi:hypothetical protein